VSRRAVVEQEFLRRRSALMDNLQEGAVVRGSVKNLTDYGAFVDLGGIDGLLHITDMAWKRVNTPPRSSRWAMRSTCVFSNSTASARACRSAKAARRGSVGDIARRYPPNTRGLRQGHNIADYGAFVEIEDGVEGLVQRIGMDWTNKNVNLPKSCIPVRKSEVMVLDVDEETATHLAGPQQCKANPWKEFAENHNRGDKVSGQIKSITDFGIFIGLPGNIDGLVHLSDISWDLTGERPCATTRRVSRSRPWCCRRSGT